MQINFLHLYVRHIRKEKLLRIRPVFRKVPLKWNLLRMFPVALLYLKWQQQQDTKCIWSDNRKTQMRLLQVYWCSWRGIYEALFLSPSPFFCLEIVGKPTESLLASHPHANEAQRIWRTKQTERKRIVVVIAGNGICVNLPTRGKERGRGLIRKVYATVSLHFYVISIKSHCHLT